ncbi:hypothetical protein JXQ70_00555 [bacterium]|nr:hypothetical protein [bacterium]
MFIDRRHNRSDKVYEAVTKQLQAVVLDGKLQTALLADSDGLVIAAANNDPLNDSLGVIGGSLLTERNGDGHSHETTYILKRREGNYSIVYHQFSLLDQDVIFLALGSELDTVKPLVLRAVTGTKRILEN